jgi:GST-like protein
MLVGLICDAAADTAAAAAAALLLKTATMQARLTGRHYIMGDDYTIADIANFPWLVCLSAFYNADEALGLADFKAVQAWVARCMERPASKVR